MTPTLWLELVGLILPVLAAGITGYVAYRIFKFKIEHQMKAAEKRFEAIEDAERLQEKNNAAQEREIGSIGRELSLVQRDFIHFNKAYETFAQQQSEQVAKFEKAIQHLDKTMGGLNATIQGMQNVFELVVSKQIKK